MPRKGKIRKLQNLELQIEQFSQNLSKYYELNQERVEDLIVDIKEYIEKGKSLKQFNEIGKSIECYSIALRKINNLKVFHSLSIRGEVEEYASKIKSLARLACFSCIFIIGGVITLFILKDLVYGTETLPLNPLTIPITFITIGSVIIFGIADICLILKHEKVKKRVQSEEL
jgi:hypothetical protein